MEIYFKEKYFYSEQIISQSMISWIILNGLTNQATTAGHKQVKVCYSDISAILMFVIQIPTEKRQFFFIFSGLQQSSWNDESFAWRRRQ